MNIFKRKPRLLTKLRIDEVSAVSDAANPLSKILLRKRASNAAITNATGRLAVSVESIIGDPDCDKGAMLARTFAQYQQHLDGLMKRYRKNLDVAVGEADDDEGRDNPDKDDDEDGKKSTPRFLAGSRDDDEPTDNDGADPNGAPTRHLERLRDAMKGNNMTRDQELSNFCKRHGIVTVAKSLQDDVYMTEEEFTKLLSEDCARTGRDFSKAIEGGCGSGPDNIEIAKAWRRCSDAGFASRMGKAAGSSAPSTPYFHADGSVPTMSPGKATLKPRSSGFSGKPAQQGADNPRLSIAQLQALIDAQRAEADDDESGGEAYEKLMVLAEQAHAAQPEQSVAQHFAKIFSSREHRELAMAERKANCPVARA